MTLRLAILVALTAACLLGHLFSPADWQFTHEFLFKFTYLPIVLGAIWYGRWAALGLAASFCLVYLLHIFFQLFHHFHHGLTSILLDLGLYFMVAWITGLLSDAQKEKSRQLAQAYEALKEKTAMLLEFEANARKTERLKTMGELAAAFAHEVRTPLSALQGAVEIVADEQSDDETRRKYSRTIYQEIQRINQVVGEFLKTGSGGESHTARLPLKELVQETLVVLQPVLHKRGLSYTADIPETLAVMARQDQLKQVLINLLMNAVAAAPHSGGRLALGAAQDGAGVILTVTDNGRGVPEGLRDRLFEAFATGREEGCGLGLYLSRNIIRSFGGELSLRESRPGHTEFSLSLPGAPA